MKVNILDLIDFKKVDALLEGFNKSTGFVTAILDLEGNILSKSGWRRICTEFHRVNPQTARNCAISDTVLAGEVSDGERYHFYKCLNGMVDVAVPIVINGEHIANLFSGQFFFEEPDRPFFKTQAQKLGFDAVNYLNALDNVPVVSKDKVKIAMDFLLDMTQLISEVTFQKLEQMELTEVIRSSELDLRISQQVARLGSWRLDLETNQVKWSEELYRMYGADPAQPPPPYTEHRKLFTPTSWERLSSALAHTRETGIPYELELEMAKKDGSNGWIWVRGEPVKNAAGNITALLGAAQDITERKQTEVALLESEERHRNLIQNLNAGVVVHAADTQVILHNPKALTLLGLSDGQMMGKVAIDPVWRFIYEDSTPIPIDAYPVNRVIATRSSVQNMVLGVLRPLTNDCVWLLVNAYPEFEPSGKIRQVVATFFDITERKKADEALRKSYEALRSIRETTLDGFWCVNDQGHLLDVNPAYCKMSGYTLEELLRLRIADLDANESPKKIQKRFSQLLKNGHDQYETRHRRKDGAILHVEVSTTYSKDAGGEIYAFIRDISERKQYEAQLEHIAYYDTLTKLPNRVLLADRLNLAMAHARRRGQSLAVVYLDLDNFKPINDRHGHEVGDQVLVELANGMKQALREADTLARLGGDEFIAVLLDVHDMAACVPVLNRLMSAACQPVKFGDFMIQASASIGVTFYPQTEDMDADQLLRQADHAMYQAKQAGKNRYHLFDTEQDRNLRGYHENLSRIRQALDKDELVLYYQPKVDLSTGTVFSVEALMRWQHPEKGLLPPGAFLKYTEGSDLEIVLGEWVIDTALKQLKAWGEANIFLGVSVNISANHLLHTDFSTQLALTLNRYPTVHPTSLILEILETAAISDMNQAINVLARCRELGVRISLDDFGTGYSSLTYLRTLPVDILKIDQTFVRDMLIDPSDMGIVVSVIQLAKTFKLMVIAEGVEALEQGVMLVQLGCPLMQGYGIARPMPAGDIPDWIAQWDDTAVWHTLGFDAQNFHIPSNTLGGGSLSM